MACDDAVLAATGNPRAYAGCLIDLLEKGCARRGWSMAQAAVARARDASVRIARILRVRTAVTTRVGRATLGIAAALSLACAGVALCSPQLVEFAPLEPTSAAQIAKPLPFAKALTDGSADIAASAVVPASFHPAQKPALRRSTAAKRSPATRPSRRMAAATMNAPQAQVMLASFIPPDSADQNAPEPMLVVFETRASSEVASTKAAQFRTIGAQQLPSQDNPALQIHIYQLVDPNTGAPIQILHIVFVMPQHSGLTSQSI